MVIGEGGLQLASSSGVVIEFGLGIIGSGVSMRKAKVGASCPLSIEGWSVLVSPIPTVNEVCVVDTMPRGSIPDRREYLKVRMGPC